MLYTPYVSTAVHVFILCVYAYMYVRLLYMYADMRAMSLLGSSALSRCAGLGCVLLFFVFIDCWEWESTTARRRER